MKDKPDVDRLEDMLDYLDGLRESGITNMYGAGIYVQHTFGIDKTIGKDVVLYWMETFEDRHNE